MDQSFYLFVVFFLAAQFMDLSSLIRDWTRALDSGSTESQLLDRQEIPCIVFSRTSVAVQSLSTVWLFAAHKLQHTRLPCSSLSSGVCLNSSPLSWWCHPTISSPVLPFSSCPQSFPASRTWMDSYSTSFLELEIKELGQGKFPGGLVERLCTSTAGGVGLIPGQGTKIPHVCSQKINE